MKILAHSYISAAGLRLNHELIYTPKEDNWLKSIYQQMNIDYPKFYKMDNLSKMTVLASERLTKFIPITCIENDKLQLIFANSSASQHTDLRFIDSYENLGNPSPSLFVYTLPNILTGEVAIKNKWYGENCFFITQQFDESLFYDQIEFSFNRGNEICLCGWVETGNDVNTKSKIEECFLFLVAKTGNEKIELETLLNQYRNE